MVLGPHPNCVFWLPLQATGDYMGVSLRNQKVHWVYRLGEKGLTTLSIDENIGEQFAAISIDRYRCLEERVRHLWFRVPCLFLTPHLCP